MTSPASRKARKPDRPGYTLIEVLLVLALLVLLSGAMVMSIRAWTGGDLEDAADQFAAAIRFARAESAATGRRIRFEFQQEGASEQAGVMIMIEPEPLTQPGVFTQHAGCTWANLLSNRILVVSSRLTGESAYRVMEETSFEDEEKIEPITFFPDGSSDSAEITLRFRGTDYRHTAVITIDGLNGIVESQLRRVEEEGT
jgi:prepilin-type N-terminal cleavage/methylation domain-containing protein